MSILTLFRPPIALMTALSALAGYALHPSRHDPVAAACLVAGVFLLSAGCSALNQVQERDVDARMERTRRRLVACGRISPRTALAIALPPILLALVLLLRTGSVGALLGLFAFFWYNGIYTPLKRRTPFAALPGALCGALPPLIGWTAAGGHPADYRIVLVAGLLFLWQIPHFWFFALKHREDFERAALPTVFNRFAPHQVNRLALIWVLALSSSTLLLLAFGLLHHPAARLIALASGAALAVGAGRKLLSGMAETPRGEPFGRMNLALLLILSSLLVEGLL
jgi:protoheme IX farnesyltransferase